MGETEITFQVFEPFSKIENKLVKNGFNLIETYKFDDKYYSKHLMSEIKTMSYKRLMKSSILFRKTMSNKITYSVYYKNKTFDKMGNTISEEKIIAPLCDDTICEIFEKTGLTMWANVKNSSYVFKRNDVEFVVQVIEGLGVFIEIEEQADMKNLKAEEKIEKLISIAKGLGLKIGDDFFCKKPYMVLKNSIL